MSRLRQMIAESLKKILLEKENVSYPKGCIMYSFKELGAKWDAIQDMISDDDIFNEDDKYGREDNPHVTILYGLDKGIPDEDVKAVLDKLEPVEVTLDSIGIFENEKFDVVKFSITDAVLTRMNKLCKTLPYENDFPDYKAHITIAYVKSGEGKKYVKKLKGDEVLKLTSSEIFYSKPNKGGKEYYKFKEKKKDE